MKNSLMKLKEYLNERGKSKLVVIEPSSTLLGLVLRLSEAEVVMCSVGDCHIAYKLIEHGRVKTEFDVLPFEGFRDFMLKLIYTMRSNKNFIIYFINDTTERTDLEVTLRGLVVTSWLLHRHAHERDLSITLVGYKSFKGKLPYLDYVRPWVDTLIDFEEVRVDERRIGWKVNVCAEEEEELEIGDETW